MSKEKLYEVFTPVKEFQGVRRGAQFKKGKALVPEELAREFVNNFGYSCPELEGGAKEKTLQDHTVAELKEIAVNLGIETEAKAKKAELIAAIEAHDSELEDGGAEDGAGENED